jgi:lipopolysaccharide biosynthesis glycosyltransferase
MNRLAILLLPLALWTPPAAARTQLPSKPAEIHLAVVACGDRLDEALVMLQSAARSTHGHLTFHIFADDELRPRFQERLLAWPAEVRAKFTPVLYPISYPGVEDPGKWRNLFKPCASQRLFFPYLIESTDRVLYVDTDILFLRPLDDLWNLFDRFTPEQLAALAPEGEVPELNWYKRFAKHPYFQPLGVNSGVMLMDLGKMRGARWRERLLAYRAQYTAIPWGDQDLINIFFAESPEKLYVFSCDWNFRPDHCMYGSNCKAAEENGVAVVHGNRQSFHGDKQPTFRAVYDAFAAHGLEVDSGALSKAVQSGLAAVAGQSACGKVSKLLTAALEEEGEAGENFYRDVAAAQLAPWRQSGIRHEDLEKARALGRPLVKYQILGGRLYRDEKCYFPTRCAGIEHFLLEIAPELPDVEFLINVQDFPVTRIDSPLPVFSFSKIPSQHADILYPAWAFWEGGPAVKVIPSWRWDLTRLDLLQAGDALTWEEKKPAVFFRGSRTNETRDPYVLYAQQHPDLWDVRYTLNQSREQTEYVTHTLKLAPAETVSPRDHCAWRYLLNFDGVAASFRLKNVLACGGLVFYVDPQWVEFFYAKLVPGEHYVPLSLDVEEAARTVEALRADDARARRIARNGRDFIENHLTLGHIRRYWLDLLADYASLQKFAPRRDPGLVLIDDPSPPDPLSHRTPARPGEGEPDLKLLGGGAPLPGEGSAVGEGMGVRGQDLHALFLFTNVDKKPALQAKFSLAIESLFRHLELPAGARLTLHFVADPGSKVYGEKYLAAYRRPDVRFVFHDKDEWTAKIFPLVEAMQKHFSSGKGSYYNDSIFFLSIGMHRILPPEIERIVKLDFDVRFETNLYLLFQEFDRFGAENLIGLGPELQPVYRHVLRQYRHDHPQTRLGSQGPEGFPGFNAGVTMLDLGKLRKSGIYDRALAPQAVAALAEKYHFKGHLGDQDFYTLLAFEHEELFYKLDCGWNRQLCTWWKDRGYGDVFDTYHQCPGPVKMYHGNCSTPIPVE